MLSFNLDWLMIHKYTHGINLSNDLVSDWKNHVGSIHHVSSCIFTLTRRSSMCFKVFECFKKRNETSDNFNRIFKNTPPPPPPLKKESLKKKILNLNNTKNVLNYYCLFVSFFFFMGRQSIRLIVLREVNFIDKILKLTTQ